MSVHMLHVRSNNDIQCIRSINDRGECVFWMIPTQTELIATLHISRGIPFVGITEFTRSGEIVVRDVELSDVRVDPDGPLGSKLSFRGKDDEEVQLDVLSDLCCVRDFELMLNTARLVYNGMRSRG